MKILFICKKRLNYNGQSYDNCNTYGNMYGLINSAKFVSHYLSKYYNSKVEIVNDGNDIDRIVTEFDPKIVVLEALWVTPQKIEELMSLSRHRKRTWVVRIHSGLTFLAHEGIAFQWLLGYKALNLKNLYIAPNTHELYQDLSNYGLRSIYLPNIYNPPVYNTCHRRVFDDRNIHIGCFGSIRPMKNHLTQAMAAINFANNQELKLHFHINANRVEQKGDSVLKNLRYLFCGSQHNFLIEHDWMLHGDFINLVRSMDIGMQVSLSETFNIVAADFVSNKVPMVGSNQIKWLPNLFQVNDATSTKDIEKVLNYAWGFGYYLKWLSSLALHNFNQTSQDHWQDFVLKHKYCK